MSKPKLNTHIDKGVAQDAHDPSHVGLGNVDNLSAADIRAGTTKANVGLSNVTNDVQVKKAGDTMSGTLVMQNNTSYTTAQGRNVILSTADPSGGGNGDVWIKYKP